MEMTDPMNFCYFTALGWTVPHDSLSTIGSKADIGLVLGRGSYRRFGIPELRG